MPCSFATKPLDTTLRLTYDAYMTYAEQHRLEQMWVAAGGTASDQDLYDEYEAHLDREREFRYTD